MTCPLCGQRKARRMCPALNRQICAVCCGTKRLREIACPPGCGYLNASREHPAATTVRRQQRDVAQLVQFLRDFSERQSRLFLLVCSFLSSQPATDLQPVLDEDVAEAAAALAATFETASRGVIYEHRPASLPAERLAAGLKPVLVEAGKDGGTAAERDIATVLRRVQQAVADAHAAEPENRRAFLDVVGRMIRKPADAGSDEESRPGSSPRLIVP